MNSSDIKPRLLIQRRSQLWQVSDRYDTYFTAQLVYPVPERTTVQMFDYDKAAYFMPPSRQIVRKYEEAYNLLPEN